MAWANTVAVVVPSPAMSDVLEATSLIIGSHVLEGVLELDLLGNGDPILGDSRAAILLVDDHVVSSDPWWP